MAPSDRARRALHSPAHRRRRTSKARAPQIALESRRGLEHVQEGGQDERRPARYVRLGEVSRGGMGVIQRVWDTVLRRTLAMKVLDVDAARVGERSAADAVARFLEEARVTGQLAHPGVVPVHDVGTDAGGRVYFTMPLIEGRELGEVLDLARTGSEGWSLARALRALTKVCEVIAYAHSRGVIHGDLKPSNVMVGRFGEIYVVDWGLAKLVDRPGSEPASGTDAPAAGEDRTLPGTVQGTPPYMAPEQADGRPADVSFRTDVYALGAILHRLLAGRSPYVPRRGERDDQERIVELIRRGPPTPLGRLAPTAPAELVAISERAMARRPEDRYASIAELADDLHAFLETRVVSAYEGGFWAEAKKLALRSRSRVAFLGAAPFVALAATLLATWMQTRGTQELQ